MPETFFLIISIIGVIALLFEIATKGFKKPSHLIFFTVLCTVTVISIVGFVYTKFFYNPNPIVKETEKPKETSQEIPPVVKETIPQDSTKIVLAENEVDHTGILKIEIRKGDKLIPFIAYSISCASDKPLVKFKSITVVEVPIDDCTETMINLQLDQKRWLLDQYARPKILTNYDLVVNGKVIPTKYVENTNNNKSADYRVALRKKDS